MNTTETKFQFPIHLTARWVGLNSLANYSKIALTKYLLYTVLDGRTELTVVQKCLDVVGKMAVWVEIRS